MYIGMHLLFLIALAVYLWRVLRKPFTRLSPWLALCLVCLYQYEIYREILRFWEYTPVISPYRELHLNIVYFLTGAFWREVIFYAEKVLKCD